MTALILGARGVAASISPVLLIWISHESRETMSSSRGLTFPEIPFTVKAGRPKAMAFRKKIRAKSSARMQEIPRH
jgi:hypothetical protein